MKDQFGRDVKFTRESGDDLAPVRQCDIGRPFAQQALELVGCLGHFCSGVRVDAGLLAEMRA